MAKTITDDKLNEILNKFDRNSAHLIAILQDIQAEVNYLPENAINFVAKELDIPLPRIYHVATFFKAFSLKPRGDHTCHVCMGTACHVRGSRIILEELERKMGIKAGETTKDSKFSLETVNCIGACAIAPVVVVDGDYHGEIKSTKLNKMLKNYK